MIDWLIHQWQAIADINLYVAAVILLFALLGALVIVAYVGQLCVMLVTGIIKGWRAEGQRIKAAKREANSVNPPAEGQR